MFQIELPWPPSVNGYWRSFRGRQILSKRARTYKDTIAIIMAKNTFSRLSGGLSADIVLHPPDKRRRDWDNWHKAVFDALADCGLYDDDSQVNFATVRFAEPRRPGIYKLKIWEQKNGNKETN